MSTSWFHARSSARKWGGTPEDYIAIHEFIDGTKRTFGDIRHRALMHNTWGVWVCQEVFGRVIEVKKNNKTVEVAVREIAEKHIIEDLGRIPSVGDWLDNMEIKTWMGGKKRAVYEHEQIFGERK